MNESEVVPGRKMGYRVSRRWFFPALVQELLTLGAAARGRETYQLSDLGDLPDDQLAGLVPAANPPFELAVLEGQVCARNQRTGNVSHLVQATPENVFAVGRFRGRETIGAIAGELAGQMGWDDARSFGAVRELFLVLVRHLACVPANALPEPSTPAKSRSMGGDIGDSLARRDGESGR